MKLARPWNRRAASTKARRNTISRKAFKDQIRRGLLAERLEDRSLLAADFVAHPYWNVQLPNDVNSDGFVAPSDVLAIFNTINAEGARELGNPSSEGESGGRLYYDVNNDGFVSSADALSVINQINGEGAPGDPQAKIILNPINAAGAALPSVQNGQDFFLQMAGQDLRPDLFNNPDLNSDGDFPDENFRGIFSAFTDVLFENNLVAPAVNEVQTITVPGSGSSTLTYAGFTSASGTSVAGGNVNITFDQTSTATRNSSAAAIATAINNVLGAGAVTVAASGASAYRVTYAKFFNTDIPEPTATNGVTLSVFASTNPADASYSFAFVKAVTFNPDYGNAQFSAYAADDTGTYRLDDIGATYSGNTQVVVLDPVEIVRVHMFANLLPGGKTSDTAHFTTSFGTTVPENPPDPGNPSPKGMIRPQHDTLVIGNTSADPVEESCLGDDATPSQGCNVPFNNGALIVSQNGSILITTGPVSADGFSTGINEDAAATTIDLFTLGNVHLNQGASGTIELKSVGTASSGTVTKSGNNAIYTPAPDANKLNLNGPATFTYTVGLTTDTDPTKWTTAQVSVNITEANDKPVIAGPNGPLSMQENTPLAFTGANLVSLSDVDFGETGTTNVEQIDLTVAQGKLSVTAGAGVSGNNSNHVTISGTLTQINTALAGLTYTATDAPSASDTLHITATDNGNVPPPALTATPKDILINITAQNDAPVNLDNNVAIVNNSHIVVNPTTPFKFSDHSHLFTVADADSANLTVTVSLGAGQGTLDTGGAPSTSLILTGSPATINAALANLTYTPPGGSNPATLTIASNDGVAALVTSTIILDLDPGVRPFAVDDSFQFNEGTSGAQSLDVLFNDFKANGATTTIVAVGTPANNNGNGSFPAGSVVIHSGGTSLDYTPPADANFFTPSTPITFTYTIHDDVAGSTDRTATVSVTIKNLADPPDAVDDGPYGASFANGVGTTTTINAANGVLKNDTDVDNNYGNASYATLSALLVTGPTKGNLTLNPVDGSFSYTPTSFNPAQPNDTFTYKVHAVTPENAPGGIDGDTATVTIHVTAPPVATNDHFNVLEQGNPASSGNVITGTGSSPASGPDTDGEGQTLTIDTASFLQISDPSKGSVVLSANGDFQYVPPTGQNFNTTRPPAGDVTFVYKVKATDGRLSNAATVSLTVQDVNDPPTAANDTFTGVRQRTGTNVGVDQVIDVLGNDSISPDVAIGGDESKSVTGVALSAAGPFVTGPINTAGGGSVKVEGGVIKYTSPTTIPAGEHDTFFYQLSDNSSASRGGPLFAAASVDVHVVDFVPKTISGTAFVDSNANGQFNANEKVLSGVSITLTGCDFTSAATCNPSTNVIATVQTDGSGHYTFPSTGIGLAPPKTGTSYTISESQLVGLLDAPLVNGSTNIDTSTNQPIVSIVNRTFVLSWSVTDGSGDITGLDFVERGFDIRTPSQGGSLLDASGIKQEYLASSGQNGFVFELDLNGNMGWSWELDPTTTAWTGANKLVASLSTDLSTLTFSVDGQNCVLTQNYSIGGSTARFRVLGIGPNGQYIIRVDGSAAGSILTTQPYDGMFAANGAGGEGESAQVSPDFAGAADAVFADQAWA